MIALTVTFVLAVMLTLHWCRDAVVPLGRTSSGERAARVPDTVPRAL
jgi:hypothetical protein